jgi:hypothetical protein
MSLGQYLSGSGNPPSGTTTYTNVSNLPLGSDSRTYATWVQIDPNQTDIRGTLIGHGSLSSYGRSALIIIGSSKSTEAVLDFQVGSVGIPYANHFGDGKWHHLAVTYDKNSPGYGVAFYVDGNPVDGVSQRGNGFYKNSVNTVNSQNNELRYGYEYWAQLGLDYIFKGGMDDAFVWNRALSAAEISELVKDPNEFLKNNAPISQAYTADGLRNLLSKEVIYSNNFDSALGSNVTVEGNTKIVGGAVYFDGDGDGLIINDPKLSGIGNSDFSITFKFRSDGAQDPYSVLVSKYGTSYLEIANGMTARNGIYGEISGGGVYPARNYNDGQWHTVFFQRKAGSVSLSVDGVSLGTEKISSDTQNLDLTGIRIGRWQGNNLTDNNFRGYIDDLVFEKDPSIMPSNPTYSLNSGGTSFNEGSTASFTLTTTGVAPGTALNYSLSGVSSTDIVGGAMTGSVSVGSDGKATISVPIAADKITDGAETLTVTMQGVSASTSINDTSKSASYTLTPSASSYDEGSTASFDLSTTNVTPGTVLNFTLTGVSSADIDGGAVSGTVTVDSSGKAKILVPLSADKLSEGNENLTVLIENQSSTVTVVDKSLTIPLTTAAVVNEGDSFEIYFTSHYFPGAAVSVKAWGDGINKSDLNTLENFMLIDTARVGRASFTTIADKVTEGEETINFQFFNGPSPLSDVVSVKVKDTSITPPTYSLSGSTSTVNEGSTASFTLTTTGVAPGTALNYSLSGVSSTDIVGGAMTGSVSVGSDGKATISVPIAADKTTEAVETLTVAINNTTAKASATINDTSQGTSYELRNASPAVNEGATNNIFVRATNVPSGTVVPYKITGINPDRIVTDTLYGSVSKTSSSLEGSVVINAFGQATIPITVRNNYAVDGESTMQLTLGDSLAATKVTVNDTSLPEPARSYTLTPINPTVVPGATASFLLSTKNIPAGRQVNYVVSGISSTELASGSLNGTATIGANGTAKIDVALKSGLTVSETARQIQVAVVPTAEKLEPLVYSGSGTLTGTPTWAQNYGFVYVDAAKFTGGGTLNFTVNLGSGSNSASYDLFKASTPVIISGRPIDSLANAYDVGPNSTHTLTYKFGPGSDNVFKLGIEGNWSGSAGTNTYTYTGRVEPNTLPATTDPVATATVQLAQTTYSLKADSPSFDEGATATFSLTTTAPSGTVLPYTISGVTAADVSGGLLTGSVTVKSNGTATISVPIDADKITEGAETLTVAINNTMATASSIINDTSKATLTYALKNASLSTNEGSDAVFTLTTTNVPAGTVVDYAVSGVSADDIVGGALSGTILVDEAGVGTIVVPIAADKFTEGPETITISAAGRSASSLILDTSKDPVASYVITPSTASINEGSIATFTVVGSNVKLGAAASYTISGVDIGDIENAQVSGRVTFDAMGLATLYIPIAADNLTEGSESLTVMLGDTNSTITINDTSKSVSEYYLAAAEGIVEEGRVATFTVSSANAVAGTKIRYTISGTGISAKDITNGKLSGSVAIGSDSSATITIPIKADVLTEGDEDLTVTLTGLGVTETITIEDTSKSAVAAPTYALSAVEPAVSEGGEAEFLLETTGVTPGTKLKYTISGVSNADLANKKLNGTVEVGGDGTATITIPTATDALTEGTETLTLSINGQRASVALLDDNSVKVSETVLEGSKITLYKASLGGHALAAPGLKAGDALDDFVPLKASAIKDYALPKGLSAVLGYEDGSFGLIIKAGTGSKASFSEQKFSEDGIAKGKLAKLSAAQVLAKETASQTDLTGDGVIGDVIAEVYDDDGDVNQQDYGLYKTSSGAVVLGAVDLAEGDTASTSVTLMASKTKGWVVPSGTSVVGIAITEGGSLEVLTLRGKQYSAQKFDAETGLIKGKATILKTAQLDAREYYYNLDLTGDDDISVVGQETMPVGWNV